MRNPELTTLRLKRVRVHQALARLEPIVADYKAKLAELEAAIQAIAPELQLHPRRYKPNPVRYRQAERRFTIEGGNEYNYDRKALVNPEAMIRLMHSLPQGGERAAIYV